MIYTRYTFGTVMGFGMSFGLSDWHASQRTNSCVCAYLDQPQRSSAASRRSARSRCPCLAEGPLSSSWVLSSRCLSLGYRCHLAAFSTRESPTITTQQVCQCCPQACPPKKTTTMPAPKYYLHTNRIHIGGQNALVGIFTDIPNTWLCVISVLIPPPKKIFCNGCS